jgi:phosphonoacetaldehyde hydrolase
MKHIEAVIFDWAGTTVDYGCMAPIYAMQEAFQQHRVNVTLDEIRQPMGMLKVDHIKAVLNMERVKNGFSDVHGREHELTDVEKIYTEFERNIFSILDQHTSVIDGVLSVQEFLRSSAIKIGSTTGYTRKMIDIVSASASRQGYQPDQIISADEVTQGRPYPYMLHKNLARMEINDVRNVIKVGDTIVDIQEGLRAGCLSVGVIKGSSMLGMTAVEVAALSAAELDLKMRQIRYEMMTAGAHYVINSIDELPWLIDSLKQQKGN